MREVARVTLNGGLSVSHLQLPSILIGLIRVFSVILNNAFLNPTFSSLPTMLPRTPLGVINSNIQRPIDLTPFQRGQISGKATAGHSVTKISNDLNISRSTVRRTINLQPYRTDGKSLPKSGRHRISTVIDVRNILRLVRATPRITYKKIRKELDITFSNDTLKRILERKGIKNWRCKRRPLLTPNIVYKRY